MNDLPSTQEDYLLSETLYHDAAADHSAPNGRAIKELAAEDRPREKLLERGAESLSNAELLAILIGSGTRKMSAVELMSRIMADCDNKLVLLNRMSVEDLMAYNGIGEAKAITLKAASELGNRRSLESVSRDLMKFDSSADIYAYMRPILQDRGHEECWVLLLNNSARLIKRKRISTGGQTSTLVDVRMVMKAALLAEATSLILVHNHPSGASRPSRDDIQLTERVRDAARTLNLTLLDHIIVADGEYYSFSDEGKL